MFYTIFDLRSFCIIESVERSYEVSGDPSDPLELDSLADLSVYIFDLVVIHISSAYLNISGQS